MRRLGMLLACAALARADVDAKLAGIWTAKANGVVLVWDISPSGLYVARAEGEGPPPGELGTLEAKDGLFSLRATNFRSDRGAYKFDGDDKVTWTTAQGLLTFERIGAESRFEPPPPLPADRARLKAREALPVALAHARIWQPDAVLAGVDGMASADGTFDAARFPVNFLFHSPASNQGLLFSAGGPTEVGWLCSPLPMQNLVTPLGEEFLDPTEALPKAIAAGYRAGPMNPMVLRPWAGGARIAWQVGGNPMVARNFFLDAVTGEPVTFADLSGQAAAQKRLEEWTRGKAVAPGDDPAAWRASADGWAAAWDPGCRAYEAWVSGTFSGGTLRAGSMVFLYFMEAEGLRGPELRWLSVTVTPTALKGRLGNRPLEARPEPIPEGLVPPAKAAAALWALNPQVPANCTHLQLLHLGKDEEAPRRWPAEFGYARSNIGGIFLHRGPVPKGERWIWRMIARRPGGESGVGLGGNYQSHVGAVHCDATTGEPLDERAPDFGPTKFR